MSNNNIVNLDILPIDTHDVYTLGLADISHYAQGITIVDPTLQIWPPGYDKVTIPFTAKNVTIYNSNLLGLSCADEDCGLVPLPDGIWKIKYSISPHFQYVVDKTFIRTVKIEQIWGEAFLSVDLFCNSRVDAKSKAELDEVWFLIQGAIAEANRCNDSEAMNKYRLAMSMLKVFKKNQC